MKLSIIHSVLFCLTISDSRCIFKFSSLIFLLPLPVPIELLLENFLSPLALPEGSWLRRNADFLDFRSEEGIESFFALFLFASQLMLFFELAISSLISYLVSNWFTLFNLSSPPISENLRPRWTSCNEEFLRIGLGFLWVYRTSLDDLFIATYALLT